MSPSSRSIRLDRRGQAHTLEAVAAAIVLLSAIVFALQVTAVTPLSGSTSNQHIENQQGNMAEGLLEGEAKNGSLRELLLYYNTSADRFHGATGRSGEYEGTVPTTTGFGTALDETFLDRGIAANVNVYYLNADGNRRTQPLINLGTPSDHSSTATWQVTLLGSDEFRDVDGNPTGTTIDDVQTGDGSYFVGHDIDDGSADSDVFTVVEVEVVVWRM